MFVKRISAAAEFTPDKMGKSALFRGDHLFAGLNSFEPGQEHAAHAHAGQDKLYLILEGSGLVQIGDRPVHAAHVQHPPTIGLEDQPAFLFSAVIARKIGESDLRWEVPLDEVLRGSRYPSGEITT